MASLSLAFDVLARTDKAERNIDKLSDSMGRAARRGSAFGSALGTLAGGAVSSLASAVGGGLASAFRTGFGELKDYQVGFAQAEQVIKSTGGTAGVTSKHVEDLASAIQGYSGQTDDSIVAGENLLLTFTNIKNAAGKGNDVFDQTTKILADMSQALGQDSKTSAIQLGKALNDPIKGVTALSRVGVSFSEAQKKTIKKLQETGHTAAAQKVILAELNKEFGGSAKAFGDTGPGQIEKAKRSFEDFTQGLATATLPVLGQLAGLATKYVFPALKTLGGAATQIFNVLFKKDFTGGGPFQEDSPFIDGLFKARDLLGKVAVYVQQNFIPAIKQIAAFLATKVIPVFLQWYGFLATKVIPVIAKIVAAVIKNLKPAFAAIFTFIQTRMLPAFQKLIEKLKPLVIAILAIVGPVLKVASKILGFLIPIILRLAGPIFSLLIDVLGQVITTVTKVLTVATSAFSAIGKAGSSMWDVLKPVFKVLVDTFLGIVGALVNGAAKAFGWVPGIGGKLKAAAKEFNTFRDYVNGQLGLGGIKDKTVSLNVVSQAVKTATAATRNDPDYVTPSKLLASPSITINNPVAEPVSETVPKLRALAWTMS